MRPSNTEAHSTAKTDLVISLRRTKDTCDGRGSEAASKLDCGVL